MKKNKIILPLYVFIGRKKYYINLNKYRNWHYQVCDLIKKAYTEELIDQLMRLKLNGKIDLSYTYFKKDNRSRDKANVLAIQDKFFCDSLVNYGCIKDDNDDIIGNIIFRDGGIDKKNPRVEVEITET